MKGGWVLDPPFCPTCGKGLNADGTERERVDKVTPEACLDPERAAHVAEMFTQWDALIENLVQAIELAQKADLEEITLDVPGFTSIVSGFAGILDDAKMLWDERNQLAALQQGGLAAAEWLAAEIASLSGRFVNSEAASMTLEDELALRATAAPTLTPGYWLAAALSATGQEAPTDGEILDALGGGGRE